MSFQIVPVEHRYPKCFQPPKIGIAENTCIRTTNVDPQTTTEQRWIFPSGLFLWILARKSSGKGDVVKAARVLTRMILGAKAEGEEEEEIWEEIG